MNVVSWVHISDIHYCDRFQPMIQAILPSLLQAIQERHHLAGDPKLASDTAILFVTGDLTFFGTEQELNESLDRVIRPICDRIGSPLSLRKSLVTVWVSGCGL